MHLNFSIPIASAQLPLPAAAYLAAFKTVSYGNATMGLRHPIGIYNTSIASVVSAFQSAFAAETHYVTQEYDSGAETIAAETLVLAIDRLLDASIEYFADAKSIVHVMRADGSEKDLKKALKNFDDLVRDARNFCALQANEIKHKQARVRLIRADAPGLVLVGYFIDGVDANGALGPSPYIHTGNTAFSLGRALRTLACSVYFVSRALVTTLYSKTATSQVGESGLGQMSGVFESLMSMNRYIFWDEENVCPDVFKRSSNIALATTNRGKWESPPEGVRLNMVLPGDGVTDTFRMPYMGDYLNPAHNSAGRSLTRKK